MADENVEVEDDGSKYLRYEGQPPEKEPEPEPEEEPVKEPEVVEPVKEPEPEPVKREVDKDLQQIQQQIAAQKKQLEALVAAKTPEQQDTARAALEKTKGRLDAMLKIASTKVEELDPFSGTAQVAEAAHAALEGVSASDKRQAELDARLAQVESAQRALAAERRATAFERLHPELAGKYDEISAKARDATNEFFGADAASIPDSAWAKMAAKHMEELVAKEKAKVVPAKDTVKPKEGGSTSTVVKNGLPPEKKKTVISEAEEATEKYIKYNSR